MNCQYCRRDHREKNCPGCGAPAAACPPSELSGVLSAGVMSTNEVRERENSIQAQLDRLDLKITRERFKLLPQQEPDWIRK